jgi:hypothetical protein
MTGGLIQMVASGRQDIFLTVNPEITFFKKVFKRYTNFATELNRIPPEQGVEYDNVLTFILNVGDCIGKCYIEIDLPNLVFSDSYITDPNYNNMKKSQLSNYTNMITKWTNYYNNLKGYVDIELQLYRQLNNLLLSENITINILKDQVNRFNTINKTNKDFYKNKIDPKVYKIINMTGYINSITKQITTKTPNPNTTIYIEASEIIANLNIMYDNMVINLTYYNNMKNKNQKLYDTLNSNNIINFNYAPFLGHNFFDYFSLQIGGQELSRYSNEILHINQMHNIKSDYMPNYYEMIGMVPELTTFDASGKGPYKLLVPLIYWFNKDYGSSLPLVALQYATVSVTVKLKPINNIISFQNFELMYTNIVNLTISKPDDGYKLDTDLIYTSYSFDLVNNMINYKCILINDKLLQYVFPDMTSSDRDTLLQNAGYPMTKNQIQQLLHPELTMMQIEANNTDNDGLIIVYVIDMNHWVAFMVNINNPTTANLYKNIIPKVGSYYPYIDYNLYYSMIPKPNINMICESIYVDDVERRKFADSKLEYVVENFDEDIYNVPLQGYFDCELEFINPCKELLWYIQPKIFLDGISQYGQNISLLFDSMNYFKNNIFNKQKMMFNSYELLLDNINDNYYTYMLSYKYLNNVLPKGIYYNSFCLYPEETQPSGTINFSEIKGTQYMVNLNKDFITEYNNYLKLVYKNNNMIATKSQLILKFISKYYDLFIVNKGTAKLLFGI